jgi:uncharacterized protein (DUF433 family)/predicted nuclease of predicted toxin-antitoxin system
VIQKSKTKTLLNTPGIEVHPEVSGGDACVSNTRIPVWSLVRYRQLGASDADLLQWYPTLTPEDLSHAWSYYEEHREEIETEIEANEAA